MILLGEEASGLILRELDSAEVKLISKEMIALRKVNPELAGAALQQFNHFMTSGDFTPFGGLEFVKRTLAGAFGVGAAVEHLDRAGP